jgi:hypothetical protein
MDKDTRNAIERATQKARRLLQDDLAAQLEGHFDVLPSGVVATKAGSHLSACEQLQREKIVAAIEHKRAAGMKPDEAVADYIRDAAFTTLNRFVALKMLEARELVQECISRGEQSGGYKEFCGLAPGLALLPDAAGYRLYVESLFDELSVEIKVLFDRRDAASVLWPRRQTFDDLLDILNAHELSGVWAEDETIGWVYQYFNSGDERRAMRDASQAPRNSRELAVRNQFFTPRYVVQFLTDNTLGRTWYEMRKGDTVLRDRCEYLVRRPSEVFLADGAKVPPEEPTEELSQEELLRRTVHVPHRPKKDPRDLKILDPACGSGHFLLYAFDLLLAIYDEAWADPTQPKSEATGRALAIDFADRQALLREVPKLILQHNLHGVDIDPRCAQISQLALWMRAQRAFRDFSLPRAERPRIRRSNIVLAEPMPGESDLLRDFTTSLGDPVLGELFNNLVDTMKLAGELGLLMRLDQIVRMPDKGQLGLFAPPEERIRGTLLKFLSASGTDQRTRRRLFADDADHGLALLELSGKQFDVVLMNPPFGDPTGASKSYLVSNYRDKRVDLYKCFVEAGLRQLSHRGRLGAISSRTGFFLGQSRGWREDVLLACSSPALLADLGGGVLDAAVDTAAYVLEKKASSAVDAYPLASFRLLEIDDKALSLRQAAAGTLGSRTYLTSVQDFTRIPNTPFTYWAPRSVVQMFGELKPLESDGRVVRQGLETGDDFRFVRAWWEVASSSLLRAVGDGTAGDYQKESYSGGRWAAFAKGGKSGAGRSDIHLVINWGAEGRELKSFADGRYDGSGWSRLIQSTEYYFKPGLGFGRRVRRFAVAPVPRGVIFSGNSPAVFDEHLNENLWIGGFLSSDIARCLLGLMTAPRKIEIGYVAAIPLPVPSIALREQLAAAFLAAYDKGVLDARVLETDRWFVAPAGLFKTAPAPESLNTAESSTLGESLALALGILPTDATTLLAELSSATGFVEHKEAAEDGEQEEDTGFVVASTVAVLSWLAGVAFGRFDRRVVAGGRPIPANPAPFEPFNPKSPGMTVGDEPRDHSSTDIIVDDRGHRSDMTTLVAAAAAECGWRAPEDLRQWLQQEFFSVHVRMYSKSRRKAPIYWQLATPSASYSVWLYLHAFSADTLYKVQNDYIGPKLRHEEQKLDGLRREYGDNPTASQRKELDRQETFVAELRTFLDEVKRVSPLWKPDLDDGVIINFAPLWRLVPHHRPWQKECKTTWDALVDGDYDWSHLAMHLWPERVVPECAKDRSLAIAHGLEDIFWAEDSGGKWKTRPTPARPLNDLIKERTSSAVKAALDSLLSAPQPGGTSRPRGKGKRAATGGES